MSLYKKIRIDQKRAPLKYAIRLKSSDVWLHRWSAYGGFYFKTYPRIMPLGSCRRSINLMANLVGVYDAAELDAFIKTLEIVRVDLVPGDVHSTPAGIEPRTLEVKKHVMRTATVVETVTETGVRW